MGFVQVVNDNIMEGQSNICKTLAAQQWSVLTTLTLSVLTYFGKRSSSFNL